PPSRRRPRLGRGPQWSPPRSTPTGGPAVRSSPPRRRRCRRGRCPRARACAAFPASPMQLTVTLGGETTAVEVVEQAGRFGVRLGGEWLDVDARVEEGGPMSLLIDGAAWLADVGEEDGEVVVTLGGETVRLQVEEAGRRLGRRRGGAGGT